MSVQNLRVLIMSVAVMSPLLLEYATVVVKVAIMPSSEQVSWESSRLTEVKLQEHWSRTTPDRLSSSDWVLTAVLTPEKSDKSCLVQVGGHVNSNTADSTVQTVYCGDQTY